MSHSPTTTINTVRRWATLCRCARTPSQRAALYSHRAHTNLDPRASPGSLCSLHGSLASGTVLTCAAASYPAPPRPILHRRFLSCTAASYLLHRRVLSFAPPRPILHRRVLSCAAASYPAPPRPILRSYPAPPRPILRRKTSVRHPQPILDRSPILHCDL